MPIVCANIKVFQGAKMEIFKAASQQLDMSINMVSNATGTREIEKSNIQENVVEKNDDLQMSSSELAQKLEQATNELNFQMEQLKTNIRFNYNKAESTMVVQVREADTGDIIRELPSKEALRIAKYFKESIGLLFDKES